MSSDVFTISETLYKMLREHIRICHRDKCCVKKLLENLELE